MGLECFPDGIPSKTVIPEQQKSPSSPHFRILREIVAPLILANSLSSFRPQSASYSLDVFTCSSSSFPPPPPRFSACLQPNISPHVFRLIDAVRKPFVISDHTKSSGNARFRPCFFPSSCSLLRIFAWRREGLLRFFSIWESTFA